MSAPSQLCRQLLSPHPTSPPSPVRELGVSAGRDGHRLVLHYRLTGDTSALRLPEQRAAARVDGLWRHTCFEAFIGRDASPAYLEFNFSPSGEWAAYAFDGYRAGMRPHESAEAPGIVTRTGADTLDLIVTADFRGMWPSPGGALRLGLTAVIEDRAGGLSYWALKHPSDKPDFHDANGFINVQVTA
jgi:hypothetical protein